MLSEICQVSGQSDPIAKVALTCVKLRLNLQAFEKWACVVLPTQMFPVMKLAGSKVCTCASDYVAPFSFL
jgi:hypothetical protein